MSLYLKNTKIPGVKVTSSNLTGVTLPPLNNAAAAGQVLAGYDAINASGQRFVGAINTLTESNITVNENTVTIPSGYYATSITKTIESSGNNTNGEIKMVSGTVDLDVYIATFPLLNFTPKAIFLWNVEAATESDDDGNEVTVHNGLFFAALYINNNWFSQILFGSSGELYLANSSTTQLIDHDGDPNTSRTAIGINENGQYYYQLTRHNESWPPDYIDATFNYVIYGE